MRATHTCTQRRAQAEEETTSPTQRGGKDLPVPRWAARLTRAHRERRKKGEERGRKREKEGEREGKKSAQGVI